MFPFTYFQIFLASLRSAYVLVSDDCFLCYFYEYIYCPTFFLTLVASINQTYFGSFKTIWNNVIWNMYIQEFFKI